MSANPYARTGKIAEELAALHFMLKGHYIFWPVVDNGADFVAMKDGKYEGVQVKRMNESGPSNMKNKDFDLLAIVGEQHIWIIPAVNLPGTGVEVLGANSKYHIFREERLHWEKHVARASR